VLAEIFLLILAEPAVPINLTSIGKEPFHRKFGQLKAPPDRVVGRREEDYPLLEG